MAPEAEPSRQCTSCLAAPSSTISSSSRQPPHLVPEQGTRHISPLATLYKKRRSGKGASIRECTALSNISSKDPPKTIKMLFEENFSPQPLFKHFNTLKVLIRMLSLILKSFSDSPKSWLELFLNI